MGDLRKTTIKNLGFSAFSYLVRFILSGGASIILAQRLSPSDYGIVGFATIFINFLASFSDMGISSAVIQRSQLDDIGLYTGYTIKFILGIIAFAVMFLIAPMAKLFFDNSAIENVIRVLSLSFIISTFGFLPTCLLTRELNYKKLIIPQLASTIANSGLSIVLALMGFNYWSIVLASIAGAVVSVVVINFIYPVKVKFKFDKILFVEFMGFGANLFFSYFTMYIIFNSDNFIIGASLGSSMLGLYAIAYNWGSMISGKILEVVHSVLFPTFSRIQKDTNKLKESYLKVLEYVTFICVISNLTLLLCSEDFLYYVLGHGTDKWMPALATFQILLIYGIIRTFLEPIGIVIMALGKTKLLLKSNLITGAIEIIFLYPVTKIFGIEGVAILVTLSYSVQYFIYFPFLKKEIDLKYSDIWLFLKPTIISIVFTFALLCVSERFMEASLSSFILKLLLSILGYALFYNAITKRKLFKETAAIISRIRISLKSYS